MKSSRLENAVTESLAWSSGRIYSASVAKSCCDACLPELEQSGIAASWTPERIDDEPGSIVRTRGTTPRWPLR